MSPKVLVLKKTLVMFTAVAAPSIEGKESELDEHR
jgi:hypothetical protein